MCCRQTWLGPSTAVLQSKEMVTYIDNTENGKGFIK